MKNKEQDNQPVKKTLFEVTAYFAWLSAQPEFTYSLPSLAQLQKAKKKGDFVLMGKEWTSEGWIHDPILNQTDKNPTAATTASFRWVKSQK